ncbi:hypothetical protein IHN58_10620 [Deinococcus sp. 12RED42]|nr:hypothetical protein [Deinococcus sp. 12RED42]
MRYTYRPFDIRWLFWEPATKLLDEKRTEYLPHVTPKNLWLAVAANNRKGYDPPSVTRPLASLHVIERSANLFPLFLTDGLKRLETAGLVLKPNVSSALAQYLHKVEGKPEDAFLHALAVMHSLAYRTENDGALRQDWPRIPLPPKLKHLQASAELGERLAALLDQTSAFKPSADVQSIGEAKTKDGTSATLEDRKVSVRWGTLSKGKVMPGPGKKEPVKAAFDSRLGTEALRVYLSPNLYLDNVPLSVWEYKLGGYQVVKKWLSYREVDVLGRALEVTEIRELRATLQRIASLLLLSDELDANYRRVSAPATAQAVLAGAAAEAEA